jgi:hypothetical protein
LIVQDHQAEEEEQIRQRRRGEPSSKRTRVYRVAYTPAGAEAPKKKEDEGKKVSAAANERAEVKDVVDAVEGEGLAKKEDGDKKDEWREEEVVRYVVEEEEETAVQAGIDETSKRAEDDDNPWS